LIAFCGSLVRRKTCYLSITTGKALQTLEIFQSIGNFESVMVPDVTHLKSSAIAAALAAACLLASGAAPAQDAAPAAAAGNPNADAELQHRLTLSHRRRAQNQAAEQTAQALILKNQPPPAPTAERPRVRLPPHRAGRQPARHRDDAPAAPAEPNP
jgi:hypothetical protein